MVVEPEFERGFGDANILLPAEIGVHCSFVYYLAGVAVPVEWAVCFDTAVTSLFFRLSEDFRVYSVYISCIDLLTGL